MAGQGWHGNSEAHAKVGKLGGQKTSAFHDQEYYKKIGTLGGRVSPGNFKYDKTRASTAGKKGGKVKHAV